MIDQGLLGHSQGFPALDYNQESGIAYDRFRIRELEALISFTTSQTIRLILEISIMVDVVSIIIAAISLTGTVLVTVLNAWFGYFSDERKRRQESDRLLSKYRDPLLLASQDLQSRLYNLTDYRITNYFDKVDDKRDNLLLYTAYVVGQYLSWTYILRRQAQFLRFSIDKVDRKLTRILAQIRFEFSTDHYSKNSEPFMLWRGEQLAIGEVMTIKDGDELFCIGYAAFRERWAKDKPHCTRNRSGQLIEGPEYSSTGKSDKDEDTWMGDFRPWFRSIVEGVTEIAKAKKSGRPVPDHRLRRIQHLLLDLIKVLDHKDLRSDARWTTPCRPAPECKCSNSNVCNPGDCASPAQRSEA